MGVRYILNESRKISFTQSIYLILLALDPNVHCDCEVFRILVLSLNLSIYTVDLLQCRLNVFRCFGLSHFNYWPIVCHFFGQQNTRKLELEMLQEREPRFEYNDYNSTYEELLNKASKAKLTSPH